MKTKLETPQEVEVWYLLPSVRKRLVLSLIKQGLKQNEIAKHLNLTDAAVSQYIHNKRAYGIEIPEKITKQIDESALKIVNKQSTLQREVQNIMHSMRDTKFICTVCRECTGAAKSCQVCYS
ncbi:MAG TPA: hypothetical protein VJB90_02185 [Candidatus Nanoarchaeia archaeon]|nr:hypothetical protein [Candidatus Nanoarchaeia archaeon]